MLSTASAIDRRMSQSGRQFCLQFYLTGAVLWRQIILRNDSGQCERQIWSWLRIEEVLDTGSLPIGNFAHWISIAFESPAILSMVFFGEASIRDEKINKTQIYYVDFDRSFGTHAHTCVPIGRLVANPFRIGEAERKRGMNSLVAKLFDNTHEQKALKCEFHNSADSRNIFFCTRFDFILCVKKN